MANLFNRLVDYSSDEESHLESEEKNAADSDQKAREISKNSKCNSECKLLPLPNEISTMFDENSHDRFEDDPKQHGGKIRSFPHERGVWATYVYIEYDADDEFLEMIEDLKIISESHGIVLDVVEDFHVSLSRTVKLRHHWIPSFIQSLKAGINNFCKFKVMFQSLEVYENDEKTRTFLGLKIHVGLDKLLKIIEKIDLSLSEFKLPSFYQNPSFHLSVASCNGSKADKMELYMADLNIVFQSFIEAHTKCNKVWVKKICCKSGNKLFTFPLKL